MGLDRRVRSYRLDGRGRVMASPLILGSSSRRGLGGSEPNLLLHDTFTGSAAGLTLHTPDVGGPWLKGTYEWQVSVTDQAVNYYNTANYPLYNWVNVGVSDMWAQVTFTGLIYTCALTFRLTGTNDHFKVMSAPYVSYTAPGSAWRFYDVVGGVLTQRGELAGAGSDGDIVRIEAVGDSISCWINNTKFVDGYSSSFNNTATRVGIYCNSKCSRAYADEIKVWDGKPADWPA